MFVNGKNLLTAAPIKDMFHMQHRNYGTSYGLGPAGYDIRIKEKVTFTHGVNHSCWITVLDGDITTGSRGRFTLASTLEEFQMPFDLVGTVRDKSSWARRGLSVFNTIIEPGWNGFLTLELVFNGHKSLTIPAGSGIAQILFGRLECKGDYGNGKYQNAPGLEEAKV